MTKPGLFFVFCAVFLAGCSSVAFRVTEDNLVSPGIYPGVRTNLEYLLPGTRGLHPELDPFNNSFTLLALIDMPLSFAADTFLLPHDLKEKRPVSEPRKENIPDDVEPAEEIDPEDLPVFGD